MTAMLLPGPAFQCRSGEYRVTPAHSRGAALSSGMLSNSIPGAIVTTFYGLMLANLIFAPLARFVQRRSDEEEAERQKLIDWLAIELAREGIRPGGSREQMAA